MIKITVEWLPVCTWITWMVLWLKDLPVNLFEHALILLLAVIAPCVSAFWAGWSSAKACAISDK